MLDHYFFFYSLTFLISLYLYILKPLFLCIGTLHGSLCPIGAFSFWAFIPYSFLIIPSHPVKSIILFSTFLLPTNEREIKHPPP